MLGFPAIPDLSQLPSLMTVFLQSFRWNAGPSKSSMEKRRSCTYLQTCAHLLGLDKLCAPAHCSLGSPGVSC